MSAGWLGCRDLCFSNKGLGNKDRNFFRMNTSVQKPKQMQRRALFISLTEL